MSPNHTVGAIYEEQCTGRPFTRLHIRKILLTDELGDRFGDRNKKRLRGVPSSDLAELQRSLTVGRGDDLPVGSVAFEEAIHGTKHVDRLARRWPAHVLVNEMPEPFSQLSCLASELIQVVWRRAGSQHFEIRLRNEHSPAQPRQQAFAILDPVDDRIDRRGY
jgi:hypothetical protein